MPINTSQGDCFSADHKLLDDHSLISWVGFSFDFLNRLITKMTCERFVQCRRIRIPAFYLERHRAPARRSCGSNNAGSSERLLGGYGCTHLVYVGFYCTLQYILSLPNGYHQDHDADLPHRAGLKGALRTAAEREHRSITNMMEVLIPGLLSATQHRIRPGK